MRVRSFLLFVAITIGFLWLLVYFPQTPARVNAQAFRMPLMCDQTAALAGTVNHIAVPAVGSGYVVAICGWSFTVDQPARVSFWTCTKTTNLCDTAQARYGGGYVLPTPGTPVEFGVGVSAVLIAPAGKEVAMIAEPLVAGGAVPNLGGFVSYTVYQPQ